jgi:Predicted transcriptional regulator
MYYETYNLPASNTAQAYSYSNLISIFFKVNRGSFFTRICAHVTPGSCKVQIPSVYIYLYMGTISIYNSHSTLLLLI